MTRPNGDLQPDYVLKRLDERARLVDVLLVEGLLCAAAIGLLLLLPAAAPMNEPDRGTFIVRSYPVCSPAVTPEWIEGYDEPTPDEELGRTDRDCSSMPAPHAVIAPSSPGEKDTTEQIRSPSHRG